MGGPISVSDAEYPMLLKQVPGPPKSLYYKGNLYPEIFENCISVVGSRKMSFYGKKVIEHLFSTLSKDITIVSGFMTGVDAESHSQAIKMGLKTIAVMPCGIDCIHPGNQKQLYDNIIHNHGLIISEYEGNFEPKFWTYPRRNRIVAGLSKITIVVEAAVNSGSLMTARISHSYGRDVLVVPGSIFSNLSAGKIQISNEFAKSVDSGSYINKLLGLDTLKMLVRNTEETEESPIIEALANEPATLDELSVFLSRSISDLSTELTLLSLKGLVEERGGKFYAC